MSGLPQTAWQVFKDTVAEFQRDDCMQMAGALAYYTVFSLPALLVLLVMIAGVQFGEQAVQGRIAQEIERFVGPDVARQTQTMISAASESLADRSGFWATVLGAAALIFAATGAFAQLQKALNRAWNVQPHPDRSSVLNFLLKRAVSFVMVVGVGVLVAVSFVLSTVLSAFGRDLQEWLPWLPVNVPQLIDFGFSFAIITLLFAAIYRILPDARIAWRDVWTGALVTSLLFVIGKMVVGFYLGRTDPGSPFGAAGSLALVLLWIYFSSLILLLGSEFTQVWARRRNVAIRPSEGAVRVERQTKQVERGPKAKDLPPDA